MKSLISNVLFLLFFIFCTNYRVCAHDSLIKIIIVNRNDSVWSEPINEIVMYIAGHDDYAPQTFNVSMSATVCDTIGNIDLGKLPSDFIIVAKQYGTEQIKCDHEMGRFNFAFVSFVSNDTSHHGGSFSGIVKFGSDESLVLNETRFYTPEQFIVLLKERQTKISNHKIPLEYPFKTAREERVRRRMYLSIISLLFLTVVALLVLMFMNSLTRYNERKKKDLKPKKKSNDAVIPDDKKPNVNTEKSHRSEKSEKTKKSEKSEKSEKSKKSEKKSEEKKPLLSDDKAYENYSNPSAEVAKDKSAKKDQKKEDKSNKSKENDKDKSASKEKSTEKEKSEKEEKSKKGSKESKKTEEVSAVKV